MAEDASILLVARRIGAYLTHLHVITGEGRMVEHHAMRTVEILLTSIECLIYHAILLSDACHRAEALRLNEYLAFFVLVTANLVAVEVVGTQIPLAIPAVLLHSLGHSVEVALGALGLIFLLHLLAKLHILLARKHKQTGNHQALSLGAFAVVLRPRCCSP